MPNRIIESLITFADECPDTIALVGEHEMLSYKEMLLRALNIADWFDQIRASSIGLYRENGVEWIILDLAALIAKVTLVPIPSFFSDQQIKHLLAASRLDFILCDDLNRFKKIEPGFLYDGVTMEKSAILWSLSKTDKRPADAQKPAKITFTSESSGLISGICLSFDAIDKISFSLVAALSNRLILSHINLLPLSVLLENIVGVYVPLLMGQKVYVYPGRSSGFSGRSEFDIDRLIGQLNRIKPDSLILSPEMLTALLTVIERENALSYTPSFIGLRGHRPSSKLIKEARSFGLPVCEGQVLEGLNSTVDPSIQCLLSELNLGGALYSAQIRDKSRGISGIFLNNKKEKLKWTRQPTSLL
ncbi:MAG: AMP-binding protein [Nitrospiria bacterium]